MKRVNEVPRFNGLETHTTPKHLNEENREIEFEPVATPAVPRSRVQRRASSRGKARWAGGLENFRLRRSTRIPVPSPKTIETRNGGVAAHSRAEAQSPEFPYVFLTVPGMSFDALSMPPSGIAGHSRMHCDSERTSYGNLQRRSRHTLAYLR